MDTPLPVTRIQKLTNFLTDYKAVFIALFMAITLIFQGYFFHLTATKSLNRNLLIITKSPNRVLYRWDSVRDTEHPAIAARKKDAILEVVGLTLKGEFVDYKFNENLYIRVNTVDLKTDAATVTLHETSDVKETAKTAQKGL